MRAVSDRFLAALRKSHRVRSTVDVLYDNVPLFEGLDVVDGTVTLDRTAEARGRCDLTVANFDLLSTLTPYGYEIRVRRGVVYPDGDEELVSLGIFLIQSTAVVEPGRLVRIAGIDRSQRVRDARLEDPYQIAAGTDYAGAILTLIEGNATTDPVVFTVPFRFTTTAHVTPLITLDEQADRWAEAVSMATSIGCELYFDGDGTCTLQDEPDVTTDEPVWTVDDGADGVLVEAAVNLDRATAYNRVIAAGENGGSGATYRGTATDDDPASPTYYYGPFGRKPRFYASPFIASNAQAVSAAGAILLQSLGVARSVSFSAVVNPALEASDVIIVRRTGLGVDEVHVVDSLTIPLAGGSMSAATRSRQGLT